MITLELRGLWLCKLLLLICSNWMLVIFWLLILRFDVHQFLTYFVQHLVVCVIIENNYVILQKILKVSSIWHYCNRYLKKTFSIITRCNLILVFTYNKSIAIINYGKHIVKIMCKIYIIYTIYNIIQITLNT